MVDISIVDEGYKLTYNWGVPHCRNIIFVGQKTCQKLGVLPPGLGVFKRQRQIMCSAMGRPWDSAEGRSFLVVPSVFFVNKKRTGKSPFCMGKFTTSMVIFHSYVKLPEDT